MKTYMAKKGEITARWHLVDLADHVLGRAASRIATVLMGKHRPEYTPHVDTGDFVVVVNARKVKVTGKKPAQRMYTRYSGYPSGLKATPLGKLLADNPAKLVREAVRRMQPKSRLGRAMFRKQKVNAGPEHPHQAQQPQPLDV